MNASEQLEDVARRLEADGVEGCSEKYAALAFRFMAPLATVFASWVLGRAQEQGVKRLYFLSRDCQLILAAARKLAPQFGNIDCRYLQMSKSILLPCSSDISPKGMAWLFAEAQQHSLKGLLARIELEYDEFAPFFPQAGEAGQEFVLQSEEDRQAFWTAFQQPALHEKLTRLIQQRRDAARSYFDAEGLFDPVKWALVDVGWSLNCQKALKTLMCCWGWRGEVSGFYLGAVHERCPQTETGPAEALFYSLPSTVENQRQQPTVFKHYILIENLFGTANHPTVHRYDFLENGTGGPCYNRVVPAATHERFQALEKAFKAFAECCVEFSQDLADPAIAAERVETLILDFLNEADPEMVRPLMDVEFSFTRDDLKLFPLVRPLTWGEAMIPIFPSWPCLKPLRKGPTVMWHKGSVAVSSRMVRILYYVAYRVRSVRMRFKLFR